MNDILIPIAVAVISVGLTALVTIKLKFATSEAEAMTGLFNIGKKSLFYCWMLWLLYGLYQQLISAAELTRASVFAISMYVTCIAIMVIVDLISRIVKVLGTIAETQIIHSESIQMQTDAIQGSAGKTNSHD